MLTYCTAALKAGNNGKKCVIALLAAPFAAAVLLLLLSLLPQNPLRQHITQAMEQEYLTNYPEYLGFREIDMYTECMGLGIATLMSPTLTSLTAMSTHGECQGLSSAARQGFPESVSSYPRYIHGYQILLKPLYTAFGFTEARLFTASGSLLLLLLLYFAARPRLGEAYALALTGSFVLAGTLHVFLLATHAVQFWLVLGGAVTVLCLRQQTPLFTFCLIGLSDAFVTFLNMGSLSLGFPLLCFCLAAWVEKRPSRDILFSALLCCAAWAAGLLSLWLCKWGLSRLVLPATSLLGDTVAHYTADGPLMILHALANNLLNSLWPVWLPLFVLLGLRLKNSGLHIPEGLHVILLPALIPVFWMCLIPGQSGVKHASFVSIIVWPLLASCLFLLLAMPRPQTAASTLPELILTAFQDVRKKVKEELP